MPIPFILAVVGLSTATVGVAKGLSGKKKFNRAKEIGDAAYSQYRYEVSQMENEKRILIKSAEAYAELHLDINQTTIQRFISVIQGFKVGSSKTQTHKILLNLKISSRQFNQYHQTSFGTEDMVSGSVKTVATGVAVNQGILAIAGLIGTASTGTAISSLSGAAAANSTLAWLGGGSIAAGGGGMAVGSLVLGGVTLGPALMIGGFVISAKGDEALETAEQYQYQIKQAILELHSAKKFLDEILKIINSLSVIVKDINKKINSDLDKISSKSLDEQQSLASLKNINILLKVIKKIQNTPILNKDGNLNPYVNDLLNPELVNIVTKEIEKKEKNKKKLIFLSLGLALAVIFSFFIGHLVNNHQPSKKIIKLHKNK